MAIESIAKTLGSGSGIDIAALVNGLVDAQYAAKNQTLTNRSETLKAQISTVSELKSNISSFDTALKTLIQTGTLKTQATSSNTGVIKASVLTGSTLSSLATSVEVRQLATAQSSYTGTVADKSAAIGTGKLTLTFGTATVASGSMTAFTAGGATPVEIDITASNNSLTGIAAAINAKNAGVTATIMSDSGGARLVLKSATGGTQAFTLSATEDVGAEGLAALNVGVGATNTTIGSAAQDAIVAVDGVPIRRSSNAILDLVPGVRLDLVSAAPGTNVNLGAEPPTAALGQAVNDFVSTYNALLAQLKTATDPVNGVLKSDPAAKSLQRALSRMTNEELITGVAAETPDTLAEMGVATNRDGTLRVDTARLSKALSEHGANVEAMFKSGAGLSKRLAAITTEATSIRFGLGASNIRYTEAQTRLSEEQEKAVNAAEALRTRMTQQFAGMDSAVSRYKAIQSQLTNQIAAWNSNG